MGSPFSRADRDRAVVFMLFQAACQLRLLVVCKLILLSLSEAVAVYLRLKYNARVGLYSGPKVRCCDRMTVDTYPFCISFQLGKQPKGTT